MKIEEMKTIEYNVLLSEEDVNAISTVMSIMYMCIEKKLELECCSDGFYINTDDFKMVNDILKHFYNYERTYIK